MYPPSSDGKDTSRISIRATPRSVDSPNATPSTPRYRAAAADIIKIAMNRVAAALKAGGYKARMILQVHDELVLDTPKEEAQAVMELVRKEMEGVVQLQVPLTAECGCGANWLEAH